MIRILTRTEIIRRRRRLWHQGVGYNIRSRAQGGSRRIARIRQESDQGVLRESGEEASSCEVGWHQRRIYHETEVSAQVGPAALEP